MRNLDYTKIISPHSSHKCREICEIKWSFAEINIFQSGWLRLRTQMCDLTGIQFLDFGFFNRAYPVLAPTRPLSHCGPRVLQENISCSCSSKPLSHCGPLVLKQNISCSFPSIEPLWTSGSLKPMSQLGEIHHRSPRGDPCLKSGKNPAVIRR